MNRKFTILTTVSLSLVALFLYFAEFNHDVRNRELNNNRNVVDPTSYSEPNEQHNNGEAVTEEIKPSPKKGYDANGDVTHRQSQNQFTPSSKSKVEEANKYFGDISIFASEAKWDELIELAYIFQTENPELIDVIFVEAAKNNAPSYLYSTLSAMGASLPENAIKYLIGNSDVITLENLTTNYNLDLNHTDEILGNAFSHAAFNNVDIDVFDFLIRSNVTLDNSGRFEPLQELIVKTVISGDGDGLLKIEKLIEYGAEITQEHYEYALKYRNYRPELFSLIDSYQKRKKSQQGSS